MVTIDQIYSARERLRGIARITPLTPTKALGENLYIKAENLQLTGAFKLRGAYNKLSCLTDEEKARGVIACSAGNHAQGIALSASKLGIRSIICMPAAAPISKIHATESYGAEVVLVPGTYDDAAAKAHELAETHGYTFAHPFDDPLVIAGQGTIGIEILEQLPDVEQVVVPIGGGGLIAGIAMTIKTLRPSCRVIGVQVAGAPSMYNSIQQQEIITLPNVTTIADGIAVKRPGELTFAMCQKYVDDIVVVDDDQVAAAIVTLMEDQKTVAEGAGACAMAAALAGLVDASTKKTVCVVSGGNVDMTTLSRVINKGLVSFGRICQLSVKITDRPGGLVALLQTIAQTGANVVSVTHARQAKNCDVGACVVSMGLETHNHQHIQDIMIALEKAGYNATFK